MSAEAITHTTRSICDVIGRKVIAERLGVAKTQVSNVIVEGRFPARWYDQMETLCAEHGVDCPRDLFSFIRPPESAA